MDKITYNTETGELLRKGKPCGYRHKTPNGEYRLRVCIDGNTFLVHRLVWEMHFGKIPKGYCVDHINGDATDNRLKNLRLATRSQNNKNRRVNKNSKSGYKGVVYVSQTNSYRVYLYCDGKQYSRSGFKSPEKAAAYYNTLAKEKFGEFARLNSV